MNAEVARLGADHLVVTTKTTRADTVRDNDAATIATARRRAVVRILTGYEPALAFLQELSAEQRRKKCPAEKS